MVRIEALCPHCKSMRVFELNKFGEYRVLPDPNQSVHRQIKSPVLGTDQVETYGCAACTYCGQPVLFYFHCRLDQVAEINHSMNPQRKYDNDPPQIIGQYPAPEHPFTHSEIPPKADEIFQDVQKMQWEGKAPALIVSGCRSVLESILNHLGAQGSSIRDKIEDLASCGKITLVLKDWANHIRMEGNKAVHEMESSVADAEEIVDFTRIFIEYTIVLPKKIADSKSAREKAQLHAG